jgi:prolyl-tRNA synthetase
LTNHLESEIHSAEITEDCGLNAGYIGPYHLNGNYIVLFDRSLENTNNLLCGGNAEGYHYSGLDISRDIGTVVYHDFAKVPDNGMCPKCGKSSITVSHGIEVGNIFQLGTKYTKSMGMQYLDSNGVLRYPLMGCYGIGICRLAASVCEAHHDAYGPIWPISIAPWQVHICAVRSDDKSVKEYADKLYCDLKENGMDAIYDDRAVSAGIMFSDADLLGVPVRVIVSPRNMKANCCEITSRDKSFYIKEPLNSSLNKIMETVNKLLKSKK